MYVPIPVLILSALAIFAVSPFIWRAIAHWFLGADGGY